MVLDEVRARLSYLVEVGLGYITLDRATRTLSGGETERVNLTTCLGTRLVNTLFVLDEPSIGLHPRDMNRIVEAMHRLRDAGNTLVVVEHDPAVMLAADRLIDMGPGPGERGGTIVFDGTPEAIKSRVPGQLIELRAEPLEQAQAALAGRPQVIQVQIYGNLLHVFVVDAERRIPQHVCAHVKARQEEQSGAKGQSRGSEGQ